MTIRDFKFVGLSLSRRFGRGLFRALLFVGGMMSSHWAVAEIQRVGVVQEGKAVRVSLHDTENRISAWVAVGETFMGSQVMVVSEKHDEVTLRREAGEYKVRLRNSVIQPYVDETPQIRDERFRRALFAVSLERHRALRRMKADELIQFAGNFGRVVLRREAKGDTDIIVLGLPGADPDVVREGMPSMTYKPNDGSRGYIVQFR